MEIKGRVLVTGATGFAGANIIPMLIAAGWQVRACGRNSMHKSGNCEFVAMDLAQESNLDALVADTDAILHLAARTHVMREVASDPLAEYRRSNVAPTARLVEAAARNKVKHFIFASSLKVHGETSGNRPIREDDPLRAQDPYGVSKIEAERLVIEKSADSGMSASILRLPLMVGPGVKGNLLRLAKLVASGVPLPFAAISNRRSLLNVDNLGAAIFALLEKPVAGHRTYLISDGHDVSTADLLRSMAAVLGRPARLFPFPQGLLRLAATATGFGAEIGRLTDSLQVDISHIRDTLNWTPPFSFDEGIAKTIHAMVRPTAAN
jgi:nucleoside-diphosphate-sugar epimerase